MIHSMTAFARTEHHAADTTLIWEIRTVNSRHLEINPRLPEPFREIEGPLRDRLRQALSRGKLDITLKYQSTGTDSEISLNEALVQQLAEAARRIQALVPEATPLSISQLLNTPGVLQGSDTRFAALLPEALKALEPALAQLQENRAREGAALAAIIEQRLEQMLQQVAIVRAALPRIYQAQKQKLQKKVEEVLTSHEPERLEQEFVIFAQRIDVAEEMDRLETHITEVRRTLKKGGTLGRRLDFLLQELNREANTLGSKSVDIETTNASVELKVLIEQVREQIQNIE